MRLTTEALEEIEDIQPADLLQVFDEEGFGNFAVLSASDSEFIQAASAWSPTRECEVFLEQHHSDPWVLEYHDKEGRLPLRANGLFSLTQVTQAFVSYLQGGTEWRSGKEWIEIKG
jgi:hypothetical protein